ncbi:MAG: bifunctional demethylmenaquinone methyltransferase/2-methoxy-6-polyprenyl-1,4-benzoquinol methylase UbiE [Bacteroidota bacterium]
MMNERDTSLTDGGQDPAKIQSMFNSIAPTYDLLNHLLSFGMDIRWRKKAISLLEEKRGGAFLDIAAGSGDLSIDALVLNPHMLVAVDFAFNMLTVFNGKICGTDKSFNIVRMVSCDALHLPFESNSFDATMVAFGIRNFADRLKGLQEMNRVLRPGGISLILELTEPKAPVISQCYSLYAKGILPLFGKIVSKHNAAYSYLPASIAKFPEKDEFLELMRRAEFIECKNYSLTFGAATIFTGRKT